MAATWKIGASQGYKYTRMLLLVRVVGICFLRVHAACRVNILHWLEEEIIVAPHVQSFLRTSHGRPHVLVAKLRRNR